MQEVTGSSPVSPTIKNNGLRKFMRNPFSFGAHLDAVKLSSLDPQFQSCAIKSFSIVANLRLKTKTPQHRKTHRL